MLDASVIPAFPYEGALYWFFGEVTVRHSRTHPYYRSLYGPDVENTAVRAAALACLFERIVLARADAVLPESSGLRLVVEPSQAEWDEQDGQVARAALQTDAIKSVLDGHAFFRGDDWAQRHLITRSVQQMRLAVRTGSTLIGNQFFHDISKFLAPIIRQVLGHDSLGSKPEPPIALDTGVLPVVGLDFAPSSVEAFAAVRESKEVAAYAAGFREALSRAVESGDLREQMLRLMRQAMDHERVAELAVKGFESAGSMLNFAGLVPVLGTVTTIAGIGVDASARLAERTAATNRWYLLGPKLQEVQLKELIRKATSA